MRLLCLGVAAMVWGQGASPATLLSSLSADKATEHHTAFQFDVKVKENVINLRDLPSVKGVSCVYTETAAATNVELDFIVNDTTIAQRWGKGTILNGGYEWGCKYKNFPNIILAKIDSISTPSALSSTQFALTVLGSVVSFTECFEQAHMNLHAVSLPHNPRLKHTLSVPDGDFETLSAHLDNLELRAKGSAHTNSIRLTNKEGQPLEQSEKDAEVKKVGKRGEKRVEKQEMEDKITRGLSEQEKMGMRDQRMQTSLDEIVIPPQTTVRMGGPQRALLQTACSFTSTPRVFGYNTNFQCTGGGSFRVNYTTTSTNDDTYATWLTTSPWCSLTMGSNDDPRDVNSNFAWISSGSCSQGKASCSKSLIVAEQNSICLYLTCHNLIQNCRITTTFTTTVVPSCAPNEFQCQDARCIPRDNWCDGGNDCGDNSDEDSRCVGTVVRPVRNQVWRPGGNVTVSWNGTYSPAAHVRIELWNDNDLTPDVKLTTIVTDAPNLGSYNFTFNHFPGFSARSDAFIRVIFQNNYGLYKVADSFDFNLDYSISYLDVVEPRAGTVLTKGTQTVITWNSTAISAFDTMSIRLRNYNVLWNNYDYGYITDNTQNTGQYIWEIPTWYYSGWTATTDFYLELFSVQTGVTATSGFFSLETNPTGNMRIIKPRAPDVYHPGDWIHIEWMRNSVLYTETIIFSMWIDLDTVDQPILISTDPLSSPTATITGNNTGNFSIYLDPAVVNSTIHPVYVMIAYAGAVGYPPAESERFMVVGEERFSWNFNNATQRANKTFVTVNSSCEAVAAQPCRSAAEATTQAMQSKIGCFLCEEGQDVRTAVVCDDCYMKGWSAVTKFEWHKYNTTTPTDFFALTVTGIVTLDLNMLATIRRSFTSSAQTNVLTASPMFAVPFRLGSVDLSFGLIMSTDLLLQYDVEGNGTVAAGGEFDLIYSGALLKTATGRETFDRHVDMVWKRTKDVSFDLAGEVSIEIGFVPTLVFSMGPGRDFLTLVANAYLRFSNDLGYPAWGPGPFYTPFEGAPLSVSSTNLCNTSHYSRYVFLAGVKDAQMTIAVNFSNTFLAYSKGAVAVNVPPRGPSPVFTGCLLNELENVPPVLMQFSQNPFSTFSQANNRAFCALLVADLARALGVRPGRFYIDFRTLIKQSTRMQVRVAILPPVLGEELSSALRGRLLALLAQMGTELTDGTVTQYYIPAPPPTASPTTKRAPTSPTTRSVNGARTSFAVAVATIVLPLFAIA